jgi:hypothetical protein
MNQDERRWMFETLPAGDELPIGCQYSFGIDGEGAPPGWTVDRVPAMLSEGTRLVDQHGNIIPSDRLLCPGLFDETDALVATWDEGRWWTPEESAAFIERSR